VRKFIGSDLSLNDLSPEAEVKIYTFFSLPDVMFVFYYQRTATVNSPTRDFPTHGVVSSSKDFTWWY
jgi:hypothetical protein